MRTLLIDDKDYVKAKKLLTEHGINAESETEKSIPFLRRGDARPDQTPASFGGIWAEDERTMESIRSKAWPKRN